MSQNPKETVASATPSTVEAKPTSTEATPQLVTLTVPTGEPDIPAGGIDIKVIDSPATPEEAHSDELAFECVDDFEQAVEHFGEDGQDDFITQQDVDRVAAEKAKWIQKSGISKHKGALHRALGVPEDKPIPLGTIRKAAKSTGRLGRMARMALTMRRFKKEAVAEPKKEKVVLTSPPMETKAEAVKAIDDLKQAIVDAPVVDLTLGEKIVQAIRDGFASNKGKPAEEKVEQPKVEPPKAEPVKVAAPVAEAVKVEEKIVPKTEPEAPKLEPKVVVEKTETKEDTTLPESTKLEEAGKGVVEVPEPRKEKEPFDYKRVVAEAVRVTSCGSKEQHISEAKIDVGGKTYESNEYTFSNAGSAIPEIWAADVLATTEEYGVLDKVVVHYPDVKGKPGDTVNVPTLGAVTFAAGTEATEATGQAPTTSGVPIVIAERVAEVKFDKALAEDCVPDLINKINQAFARGYEYDFDDRVLAWLESPATAIGGTMVSTGVLAGTKIASLMGSFRAATHEPKYLIIHPVQEAQLLQDDQFVNAATYGDNSVIKSGRVWNYLGLDIVMSPQIVATGGTYRSFMISDKAIGVANKRDFSIDSYYHPPSRVQYFIAGARYGGTILLPNEVFELKTTS